MLSLSGTAFGGQVTPFVRPDETCWHVCLWVRSFYLLFLGALPQLLGSLGSCESDSQRATGGQVSRNDGICGFGLFVNTIFVC